MMCRPAKLTVTFYGFWQIFFIFLCSAISAVALIGENICYRGNESFCCKDYEEKNDMCVECRPGFWGYKCNLTCPEPHYGPLCRMLCSCSNVHEYCHHICGCISNLTKPFVNITDIEQNLSIESCLSLIKQSIERTVNNVGKNNVYITEIGINTAEKDNDGVHDALYITQELNRENSTLGRGEASGDPLYGSREDPCYSTLLLRVNYGPIRSCNQNGPPEDFNPYDYRYEGERNVTGELGTNDNNIYVYKESGQTHISSTQRQFEDSYNNSLLRHSSQRMFDLMPVDEIDSAIRGKKDGP